MSITIKSNGPASDDTTIEMNGKMLDGVTSIAINMQPREIIKISLGIMVEQLDIEGEEDYLLTQIGDRRYRLIDEDKYEVITIKPISQEIKP